MNRPELSEELSAAEFSRWYWLKAELVGFCRHHRLSPSGAKVELSDRIASYLVGDPVPTATPPKSRRTEMPQRIDLSSVIGPGWRLTRELRHFFEAHLGKGFHFNDALRRFIFDRAGSTFKDALEHYRRSLDAPVRPIAAQFEYNRHMRDFREANPKATRTEMIAAWWVKRALPAD